MFRPHVQVLHDLLLYPIHTLLVLHAEPRAYEWDIAAGHAILEHAGGTLKDFNGNEIEYGKADFKNPSLILRGKHIS